MDLPLSISQIFMKTTRLLAALSMMVAAPLVLQAADAPKPYPLQTCFISGDKLGEMGKPVVITYEGQEIKFCCRECKSEFQANPAAGMKKFNEAVAQAAATKK